jgi:adenylate cyclase
MKQSPLRDALRRIEDIVAEATGAKLDAAAETRLENVLRTLTGGSLETASDNFSSQEVTILLSDLRGFTSMTSRHPAGVVLEVLNRCFVEMSGIIVRHHGQIDKFMGDSIMVIFLGRRADGNDVRRALHCALDMQVAMERLNEESRKRGLPELFMGIGINTGTVMAGLLGSEVYSAYTVIGEEVNLASRIEAFSLRGQILMAESTHRQSRGFAEAGPPMQVYVKGRDERVTVYELLSLPSLGKQVPRQEIRRSPRVEVTLPFTYEIVRGDLVVPGKRQGAILDIGYHGVLAEVLDPEVGLHSELKVDIALPLISYSARGIYGRVVKTVTRGSRSLFGIEFTSVDGDVQSHLQLFVQMLIQGRSGG